MNTYRSRHSRPHETGSVLVYSLLMIVVLLGMLSLAVDYGRMQMIKTQLQRTADATARSAMAMYALDGSSTAYAYAPFFATNAYNKMDAYSGIQPTAVITWGWWNATTKTFTAGSGSPVAVQVSISRTKQNSNAVPLSFPLMNGTGAINTSCDVRATAIAVLDSAASTSMNVSAKADIWLSGMPAGSNAGWTDSPANAPPVQAMTVTPGAVLSFSASGTTGYSGPTPTIQADGASYNTTHMKGSPDGNYNGLQNGIQTLTAPQNALIGVFLTNSAPNTQTPPSTALDYSSGLSTTAQSFQNIQLQQPFFIGDGQGSSGAQTFVVPPNATRLFIGVFDGWQNNDNPGSLTVNTSQKPRIYLVK